MTRIKSRISQIEQALTPTNGKDTVVVTYPYRTDPEKVLEKHLTTHPEAIGARCYVMITDFSKEGKSTELMCS